MISHPNLNWLSWWNMQPTRRFGALNGLFCSRKSAVTLRLILLDIIWLCFDSLALAILISWISKLLLLSEANNFSSGLSFYSWTRLGDRVLVLVRRSSWFIERRSVYKRLSLDTLLSPQLACIFVLGSLSDFGSI